MMYEPSLSIFMCAALPRAGDYAARMCVCSSRAAAVAAMMADAEIERVSGKKGKPGSGVCKIRRRAELTFSGRFSTTGSF